MAQAGIDMDQEDATRFACVFGSGIGGMEVFERESIVLHEKRGKARKPAVYSDHDLEHGGR